MCRLQFDLKFDDDTCHMRKNCKIVKSSSLVKSAVKRGAYYLTCLFFAKNKLKSKKIKISNYFLHDLEIVQIFHRLSS